MKKCLTSLIIKEVQIKPTVAVCHMYCEDEDASQTLDIPVNVDIATLPWSDAVFLWGLKSHKCKTQLPGKKNKRLWIKTWLGNRNWLLFKLSAVMYWSWPKVFHWTVLLRQGLCMLTCPPGEWICCWNQKLLGWKIDLQSLNEVSYYLFSVSNPEMWVNSWGEQNWTHQIQLLWFRKPQQLKIRISEHFGVVSIYF